MSQEFLQALFGQSMTLVVKLALPLLVAGLGVGLLVSILQALTQVQEMTLTFVPKVVALVFIIVVAGPWMLNSLLAYTYELWQQIPNMTASLPGG